MQYDVQHIIQQIVCVYFYIVRSTTSLNRVMYSSVNAFTFTIAFTQFNESANNSFEDTLHKYSYSLTLL
jgi:hypothetical protein